MRRSVWWDVLNGTSLIDSRARVVPKGGKVRGKSQATECGQARSSTELERQKDDRALICICLYTITWLFDVSARAVFTLQLFGECVTD